VKYKIKAAVRCEIGTVRSNNEDNFYFGGKILNEKNRGLTKTKQKTFCRKTCFGVFDGMGGQQWGEKAAWLAAKEARKRRQSLSALCRRMNDAICDHMQRSGCGRMGSTAVMALFGKETVSICNLGDSKAFLFRDGSLQQLSEDHTDEKAVLALGLKRKPLLTQHLGLFSDELELEPYEKELGLHLGDRYLLCSDGLTDMLTQAEICEIMADGSCGDCVDRLVDAALDHGGKDNVTVIVCEVK